ncbi:MAG: cation transporter, partial [Prevotella sp.]
MEQKRDKAIYRVTIWGSLINVGLLIFKFAAGILGHSAAMIADAVHSLSDFVTDAIVLIFVKLSNKPVDED